VRISSLVACLAVATHAYAARYYVRTGGDDTADGTSRAHAWRSVARVNAADLEPGDTVLFEADGVFAGRLELGPEDAGTPEHPVTITSTGRGRATIDAGPGGGILVYDAGGVVLRRLRVVGSGRDSGNDTDGIAFISDIAVPGTRLAYVRVAQVEVTAFGRVGLVLGGYAVDALGAPVKTGYANVRFTAVDAHDNSDAGILTYGSFGTAVSGWAHANVIVRKCQSHQNPGIPGKHGNSGNGIVLVDVDGGLISHSQAWDNGWRNDWTSGPIGIWTWDSRNVVIERNEVWGNRLATRDNGGFDLDGGATSCVLRRNVSHDNAGTGFLVYQFAGSRPTTDNLVIGNTSRNDGRTNGGGLVAGGGAVRTTFARNLVRLGSRPAGTGTTDGPYGLHIVHDGAINTDLTFRDNRIVTEDGVPLIVVAEPDHQLALRFTDNRYDTTGASAPILWGADTYTSVAAWSAATGLGP
jgi:parallel beta helix pectate lyase-like protein